MPDGSTLLIVADAGCIRSVSRDPCTQRVAIALLLIGSDYLPVGVDDFHDGIESRTEPSCVDEADDFLAGFSLKAISINVARSGQYTVYRHGQCQFLGFAERVVWLPLL